MQEVRAPLIRGGGSDILLEPSVKVFGCGVQALSLSSNVLRAPCVDFTCMQQMRLVHVLRLERVGQRTQPFSFA